VTHNIVYIVKKNPKVEQRLEEVNSLQCNH
jgi:hypothetical protein